MNPRRKDAQEGAKVGFLPCPGAEGGVRKAAREALEKLAAI